MLEPNQLCHITLMSANSEMIIFFLSKRLLAINMAISYPRVSISFFISIVMAHFTYQKTVKFILQI